MALFIQQKKPVDFDCGYHLELLIDSIPRIENEEERLNQVDIILEIIKRRHRSWVYPNGDSPQSWDHFFELANFNPEDFGIKHPFGYPPEPTVNPE